MYRFFFFIICIGILLPSSYIYADEYTNTASWLKRLLRLDQSIRASTSSSIDKKQKRATIIKNNIEDIENLVHTWNYVPTTDKTLSYTLTLQKYKLSCEIAAMKAIYGGLRYPRSEDEIIKTLPVHNAPYDKVNGTWWDPDKEFVGLINGSQNEKTWYWIYETAIEKNFHQELGKYITTLRTESWNELTRPIEYTDETHLTHLLEAIDNGWHVILWWDWCTNPDYEDGVLPRDKTRIMQLFPIPWKNTCKSWNLDRDFGWKTKEWKEVMAFNGDHVFILLGYIGKKENPSHIIVWDTDTGRHIYSIQEWMRKWWKLQNRSLMIWTK